LYRVLFAKYNENDSVKEDQVANAYSTHGKEWESVPCFGENQIEYYHSKDIGLNWRMMLKCNLEIQDWLI
jgi:hypothetical protein